jgi:hypothetical protein
MIENSEILNISLDFFNNSLISSLFIRLFVETRPEIISNGFIYDGLSFLLHFNNDEFVTTKPENPIISILQQNL